MKIKRRTLLLIKIWAIRVAVITVVLGLFFGYNSTTFFTITSYDIRGVDEESRLSIDTALHQTANKKVYGVFSNNKILTYSKKSIITTVHETVTDAATITVRAVGLHTVRVTVTLLTPVLRTEDNHALDENGVIFTTKKDIHTYPTLTIASSTLKTIKNNGLIFSQVTTDDAMIDSIFIENLLALSTKISSLVFPVARIFISKEGDVSLYDERGLSKVMFLRDADTKKVWSTLVSALDTDPLKTKLSTDKEGLLYLDVRYGNKVFYKFNDGTFQNGTSTDILKPHETTPQATSTLTH